MCLGKGRGVAAKEELEETRESLFHLCVIPEVKEPLWGPRGVGPEGIWDSFYRW